MTDGQTDRGDYNIPFVFFFLKSAGIMKHITSSLCGWVKIQLFQNMVMLYIKLKRIKNAAHGNKYFAHRSPSPPDPRDGVNRPKFIFFRTRSCCISN